MPLLSANITVTTESAHGLDQYNKFAKPRTGSSLSITLDLTASCASCRRYSYAEEIVPRQK